MVAKSFAFCSPAGRMNRTKKLKAEKKNMPRPVKRLLQRKRSSQSFCINSGSDFSETRDSRLQLSADLWVHPQPGQLCSGAALAILTVLVGFASSPARSRPQEKGWERFGKLRLKGCFFLSSILEASLFRSLHGPSQTHPGGSPPVVSPFPPQPLKTKVADSRGWFSILFERHPVCPAVPPKCSPKSWKPGFLEMNTGLSSEPPQKK